MNYLNRIWGLFELLNPFGPEPTIEGNRLEIISRLHRIMYGTDRD